MKNQDLHYLLEQTVKDINRSYVPGTVERIKADPVLWKKVVDLEQWMNHAVLGGDRNALVWAIGQYRKIWRSGGPKRAVLTLEVQTELPVKFLGTIREISITEADLRLLKESDEETVKKATVVPVAQAQTNVIRKGK
jgi:hypothetical protein